MTLGTVSNRLELDPDTTRWLVRLLYEEGADLLEIGDRPLPRGTPVYTKANADALELQRAMARNHVRSLFVIETHEALATVGILDLALHMDALSEGSPMSDSSGPMLEELEGTLGGTQDSHRSAGIGSDVRVCDYGSGFTIKCSDRLGVAAAEELRSSVEQCVDRQPASIHVDATDIAFLEEAGMDALLHAARRCRDAGIVYQLSISPLAKRMLHFCRSVPVE